MAFDVFCNGEAAERHQHRRGTACVKNGCLRGVGECLVEQFGDKTFVSERAVLRRKTDVVSGGFVLFGEDDVGGRSCAEQEHSLVWGTFREREDRGGAVAARDKNRGFVAAGRRIAFAEGAHDVAGLSGEHFREFGGSGTDDFADHGEGSRFGIVSADAERTAQNAVAQRGNVNVYELSGLSLCGDLRSVEHDFPVETLETAVFQNAAIGCHNFFFPVEFFKQYGIIIRESGINKPAEVFLC